MIKNTLGCMVALLVCLAGSLHAEDNPPARIAWYGDLQLGLQEAKRSDRPILLVWGAPHCFCLLYTSPSPRD